MFFGVYVPIRKKHEVLEQGQDSLYVQVFPGHFQCMRGPSLFELMKHENSAADETVSWYLC